MGAEIEMFSRHQTGIISHPKTISSNDDFHSEPNLTTYLTY